MVVVIIIVIIIVIIVVVVIAAAAAAAAAVFLVLVLILAIIFVVFQHRAETSTGGVHTSVVPQSGCTLGGYILYPLDTVLFFIY